MGRGIDETAFGILLIANELMIKAIREITITEGIDPRESAIVAGGGAAGLNILPIARELGCGRVMLPETASAPTKSCTPEPRADQLPWFQLLM